MAHDVDVPGVLHQLPQRVGHDAGLYLGALFGGLGAAAVELEIVPVLHHRLIAAPAQRHFQRQIGVFEQAVKAVAVPAHADGQRGADAAALHRADAVQHVELLLGVGGEILLLHHEQIPVAVIAQQQAAAVGAPVVELSLDIRQQRRALAFRTGLHQILVVVDHQNRHGGTGHVQRLAHLLRLGNVQPVGSGQHIVVALQLVGMAQRAEHPVGAVVPHHVFRRFPLALQQPVAVKPRHGVRHRHLKQLILQPRQTHEPVVAPQDLAGVQVEHQHRQRCVQHVAGAGGIHAAADAIQILPHAVLGHAVAPHAHIQHQRRHQRLGHRQQRRKGKGGDHKGGQTHTVQHDIGAEAADQLFTQAGHLISTSMGNIGKRSPQASDGDTTPNYNHCLLYHTFSVISTAKTLFFPRFALRGEAWRKAAKSWGCTTGERCAIICIDCRKICAFFGCFAGRRRPAVI